MKREFYVPGMPKGKGRPRFSRRTGTVYTPCGTAAYEELVKYAYLVEYGYAEPIQGPLRIMINACFEPPKSASKHQRDEMLSGREAMTKKPDADNVAKIVMDALSGMAYADDAQVVSLSVNKRYDESAGVRVTLTERDNQK